MTKSNKSLVESVQSWVPEGCVTDKMSDQGQRVTLSGLPHDRIIAKIDGCSEFSEDGVKRCDYLYADDGGGARGIIALVELKSGDRGSSQVKAQLQAGARLLEAKDDGGGHKYPFVPVAYGNKGRRNTRKLKSKMVVTFRGAAHPIVMKAIKTNLSEILHKYR